MRKFTEYLADFLWSIAYLLTLPSFLIQSLANWLLIMTEEEEEETDEREEN